MKSKEIKPLQIYERIGQTISRKDNGLMAMAMAALLSEQMKPQSQPQQ